MAIMSTGGDSGLPALNMNHKNETTQNPNRKIFDEILTESRQEQLFKEIIISSANEKLFESILREERERLQEMAKLKIQQGINYIINLIKSGVDSIKQKFCFWLMRGGEEGVSFFDEKGNNISAEKWFSIAINMAKNTQVNDIAYRNKKCTYIQIPEYRKRIQIIEAQYPKIIAFARKNGWSEGQLLTDEQLSNLERKIINELDLSSIK